MTTLAELVAAPPAATRGVPTGFVYGAGEWRHVLELADPGVGAAVVWHDLTAIDGLFTGYDYNRGSDGYQGRYRASTVALDLYATTDALAPWNPNNAATFGVHVDIGPGLLIRSGFIRVSGGAVAEWNPRFTLKVESWGDASYSKGKVRTHRVTARDTLTSLVGVPLPARTAENWFERFVWTIANSGWPYGWEAYGARHHSDGTTPILLLPDRPASSSAINEMDATLDPVGLVWYTNRKGQLVARPKVNDTFHASAFAAGADGDPWVDAPNFSFAWWACGEQPGEYEGTDHAAYAIDTPGIESFGFDETDRWVVNHLKITNPVDPGFDDDDPVSIQRYDRKTMQASWMVPNDVVAGDLLSLRANATVEARPLYTNIKLRNFHPGPAKVDFLDYLSIVHRNTDEGLEAFGNGWLRSYQERVRPLGCDTDWSLSLVVDIYAMSARSTFLKPVEDLTLVDVTDTTASFTWTNPAQDIAPTHTQVRMLNPASLWQTVEYPLDGLTWEGLSPSTDFEFQVRLIRIVDGITTHFSETRSVNFTTDETTVPVVDPETGDVDLPPPDTGCVMAWELQESATGNDPWTTIDEGVDSTEPFVLTEGVDYNLSDVTAGYWFRFVSQESCSGILGPPGYGTPNASQCVGTERLGTAPYGDDALVAYWPEVCPIGIHELVSHTPMIQGHSLKRVDVVDGIPVLVSGNSGMIGYQVVSSPAGSSDLTIACRVRFGAQPGSEKIVFEYGGAWISIVAASAGPDPEAAGFKVKANLRRPGGSVSTITGTTIYGRNTIYNLALTHDTTTGEVNLYVDTAAEETALLDPGPRASFGQMAMHLPASSWITDAAAWDRVLAPSELPGAEAPQLGSAILALNPVGYWPLDETAGTVANDVSGNARHGTYVGSYSLANVAGPTTSHTRFGVSGSSRVAIPDNDAFSGGSSIGLTWFFLVKPDDLTTQAWVIDKVNSSAGYEYVVHLNGSGTSEGRIVATKYVYYTPSDISTVTISHVVTTGWQAIAVTMSGTATAHNKIFRNSGTASTPTSAAGSLTGDMTPGTAPVWLGQASQNATYLKGGLAHVAVYRPALSDAQIGTLMDAAMADEWTGAGPIAELLAYSQSGVADGLKSTIVIGPVTPGPDCLLVLMVCAANGTPGEFSVLLLTPPVGSITGGGFDWNAAHSYNSGNYPNGFSHLAAVNVTTDPGTFSVTANFGTSGQARCHAAVLFKVTGAPLDLVDRIEAAYRAYLANWWDETVGNGPQTIELWDAYTITPPPIRSTDITLALNMAESTTPPYGATFDSANGDWVDLSTAITKVVSWNAGIRSNSTSANVMWTDVNAGSQNILSVQAALVVDSIGPPTFAWAPAAVSTTAPAVGVPSGQTAMLPKPAAGSLLVVLVSITADHDMADDITCTHFGMTFTRQHVVHSTGSSYGQGAIFTGVVPLTGVPAGPDFASVLIGWLGHALKTCSVVIYEVLEAGAIGAVGGGVLGSNSANSVDGPQSMTLSAAPAVDSVVLASLHVSTSTTATSDSAQTGGDEYILEYEDARQRAYWITQSRIDSVNSIVNWNDVHIGSATTLSGVQLAIEITPA